MTDFERRVIEGLAAVEVEVKGVKEAVAKQNGNVARVMERVNVLEESYIRNAAADAATDKANAKWHKRLDPMWTMGGMMFLYIILDHADKLKGIIFK